MYGVVSRFLARLLLRKYHPYNRKPRPYHRSKQLFIQGQGQETCQWALLQWAGCYGWDWIWISPTKLKIIIHKSQHSNFYVMGETFLRCLSRSPSNQSLELAAVLTMLQRYKEVYLPVTNKMYIKIGFCDVSFIRKQHITKQA